MLKFTFSLRVTEKNASKLAKYLDGVDPGARVAEIRRLATEGLEAGQVGHIAQGKPAIGLGSLSPASIGGRKSGLPAMVVDSVDDD